MLSCTSRTIPRGLRAPIGPALALLVVLSLAACATTRHADTTFARPARTAPPHRPDTVVDRLPQPHERVRVVFAATATEPEHVAAGAFVSLVGDTLVLTRNRQAVTIVLGEGRRLQVLLRRSDRAKAGFTIGALAGAATGGIIGSATWHPCTETGGPFDCIDYPSRGDQTLAGGLVGGLIGGLAGWGIGATKHVEVWGTVSPPATEQ